MNQSFTATIHFALLGLAMLFTANLVAAVNLAGVSCVWGVLAAMLAAGLSYTGQHYFTQAAGWLAHHQMAADPAYAGPSNPEAWDRYEFAHNRGVLSQLAAVAASALSGLLFLIGAL